MSDSHSILVVDDNEAGRYVKTRLLRQAGYRTSEAKEGYEALLCLRRDLPALVVLDIMLPGIDGLEICRRIKRDPDTAHIMVLQTSAARVSTGDRLAGLAIGADAYLIEPFEPQELLATVKALLRLHDHESENRQLVAELRESEARWRAWFDSSSVGMCQADLRSGRLLRANPYFCKLLGYSEAELIGRTVFEITHADDREPNRRAFVRLARGEINELRLEKRHLKKDGGSVWTEVTINTVKDASGEPRRSVAMVQDISRRKRHEQARMLLLDVTRGIIESQDGDGAMVEAVFEQVSSYLNADICFNYRFDPDHKVLRLVNSKGIPDEWLAAALELAIGEAFCGAVAEQLQPLVADAERIASDARGSFVRAMGARAYACHPLVNGSGQVLGTLSFASTRRARFDDDEVHFMQEITHVLALAWERKRAEAIAGRWQRLFEQSDFSLAHADAQADTFIAVNQAFAGERGYRPEELAGKPILTVYPEELHGAARASIAKADETGHELFETYHRRRDGSVFPVLLEINSFKDANGSAQVRMIYALDISQQRETEEALRASENQLRLIADNLPVFIAYCDAEARFRFVNQPYADRFGLAAAEIVGRRIEDVVGAPAFASFREYVEAALAGRMVEFEQTVPDQQGTREMRSAYIPETGADGATRGFYALIQDVTAQKLADAERRDRERFIRSLVSAVPSILYVYDFVRRRNIFISPQAGKELGYSDAEIKTMGDEVFVARVMHPEDAARIDRHIERLAALAEDQNAEFEYRMKHSNGEWRWYLSHDRVFRRAADGKVEQILGAATDITERKRWEAAIGNSEERLRLALVGADAGMWDLDLTSGALVWSPENCRLYGIEPEQFVAQYQSWRERVHGDDLAEVERLRRRAIDGGESYGVEYRIVKPSGAIRWLASRGKAYYDEHGNAVRMLGINLDITERKRADEERYKFQALVESSSDYIGMAEPDGSCFYLNPAGRALVGMERTEDISRYRPEDFVAEDERRRFVERVLPALREQGKWDGEIRLKHQRTGAVIEAQRSLFMVKDPQNGQALCMGTVSRDVREQKRLERLLQQRVEDLREADRNKDHFLALLSHELRNPLAPITNSAALLRRLLPADSKLRWCIDVIEGQLGNMSRMLEDLLDVSRITRNRLELRKASIELVPVLRQAIETSRPVIDNHEHRLVCTFPEPPIWLDGDAARLSQVVANLLNNAAKYTERGGRIELYVTPAGDQVEIHVADNGHGIAAEMLPKIFDLFIQGDSRERGGLGIGLTVCKRIIEMHGGTLEARSAGLDRGSEFIVYLPALAAPPTVLLNGTGAALAARPMRILVVDDNREQAATLGALLTDQGHDVRLAADGAAALEMIEHFVPDLGLIDIGMPGMDGCELARRLRALPELSNVVLVAQSGWGRADDRQRTQAAGFDHHLVKPLNHRALESLLAEIGKGGRFGASGG